MNNNKKLRIAGIISIPIMYIFFFLVVDFVTSHIPILKSSLDLVFFATIIIIYISLHFFLNLKKMYNWIFNYRYLIGIIVFLFLVIGGYHGSSISFWNNYIEPEVGVKDGMPIIGIARGIRSDEWLVNTPYNLSQNSKEVNYGKINNLINAKENNVTFFPRLIVKDAWVLVKPGTIGYLFLPLKNAFSFNWYFEIFASFFVIIELFMIITKKNKLYSTLGAFLIVISPVVFWWNTCSYSLYGGLALIIINKFFNTDKKLFKAALAILLGWDAACYLSIMYPAWMVPYGYFFVILFIWILIENKQRLRWNNLFYLIITAIVCGTIFLPTYFRSKDVTDVVINTVYPGKREWVGGGNWKLLFTYMSNIYLPYFKINNPCEYCQYLSLFPIPFLMGLYYIIKDKKQGKKLDMFLLLTSVFGLLLAVWCIIPLPMLISKITFMTFTTGDRAQLVVGYASIFVMIYIINKYEITPKKGKKLTVNNILKFVCSLLISTIMVWISYSTLNANFPNIIKPIMNIISIIIFVPIFFCLFNNNKKSNFILFILLMFLTFISSLLIMPVSKGLNVIFEKPFAKEIQELVRNNKNAKFLTVDERKIIQNYILAQGAKTINSTNYIPNLELWHKLDQHKKFNSIYNRYAHVLVKLVDYDTSFTLIQNDTIMVNLNYNDICKTGANYLVTTKEKKLKTKDEYYKLIYDKNDMLIYKTTCK